VGRLFQFHLTLICLALAGVAASGQTLTVMSPEPGWPAGCECKYDEARDEMDREDCPFHSDLRRVLQIKKRRPPTRKNPARTDDVKESAA